MLLTHHLLRETPPSPGLTHSLEPEEEGRRVAPDEGLARVRRNLPSGKLDHPAGVRARGGRRQDPSARFAKYRANDNLIVSSQMPA
jgi:hypothetical protein